MKALLNKLVLISMLIGMLFACKDSNSALESDCAAECLGKIRSQAQACGEDQSCKQQAMADLRQCEASCKK